MENPLTKEALQKKRQTQTGTEPRLKLRVAGSNPLTEQTLADKRRRQALDMLVEETSLTKLPSATLAKLPGMMLGATEQPRKRTGAVLIESDPERARVYDDELQKYAGTPGELKRQLRESQARDEELAADWNVELGNPDPTAKTQYLNEKYGDMDTYKKRVAESAARTEELTAWLQRNRNAMEANKWEQTLSQPDAEEMIAQGLDMDELERRMGVGGVNAASLLYAYHALHGEEGGEKASKWTVNAGLSPKSTDGDKAMAAQLTEKQAKTLAYYIGKGDWDTAERYYYAIADQLSQSAGSARAEALQGSSGVGRVLGGLGRSVKGGAENYFRNVSQNFTDDALPRPVDYYTSAYMTQWANEQDHTVEKYGYLTAQNLGNQLPSILASYLTSGVLGAAGVTGKAATAITRGAQALSVGGGAAGDAYGQALADGYGKDKARTYSVLIGASEALLENLLAGVGAKVGITDELLLGKIAHIENGLARVALSGAVRIGSEEIEENLQNYLDPLFREILFGEEYQAPSAQETIETTVVTALTTLLLGGGDIANDIADVRSDAKTRKAEAAGQMDGTALLQQAAEEAAKRGKVTNSTAENILHNDAALSALTEQADLLLTDGMSLAQQRSAVKEAVARLSGAQENAVQQGNESIPPEAETRQSAVSAPMRAEDNIRLAQRAAASLGENGAKAFRAAYDTATAETLDPAEAFRGFAQVYNAALRGEEYTAENLPAHMAAAARASGANDRAAAAQAKYFKDAGLVRDENYKKAHLSSKTRDSLDALAKAIGVKVQFAQTVADGRANGQYADGIITLALNAKDPVRTVFVHEAVHRIREIAPEAYQTLADYVRANMTAEGFASVLRTRSDLYKTGDVDALTEEAVADAFGRILGDEKILHQFARDNRSTAEKVLDALRDIVNAIKRVLNGQAVHLTKEQRAAFRDLKGKSEEMVAALQSAIRDVGTKNAAREGGTEAKFSIKNTSKMTLAEQLKQFYDGKMASSDAFYFGETPDTLKAVGLNILPLAFTQSDFVKSTKEKHNVPRRVLKALNDDLRTALFAFVDGDRIGILTGDIDGDGKPLLIGIERNVSMGHESVNAIHSVYGLDNPGPWLQNQFKAGKKFVILNEERANAFLQSYSAYLATERDNIRSIGRSIPRDGAEVKPKFSLKEDNQGRELTEAQREYFRDSKVVDEDGRLLPVYHATYETFTVFDRSKLGALTDGNATDENWAATSHIGFWFNTEDLSRKAKVGTRAEEVYLNLTDPYQAGSMEALAAQLEQYSGTPKEKGEAFAQWLRGEGYDGVVVRDEEFGGTSYIALEPEQIKRVTNQNPTGDPDTRYSMSDREQLKEYVKKYGAIPRGETPSREIVLPKRTGDGRKLSQTVRTVLEASATPDEMVPTIEKMAAAGEFSYDAYTDKQAIEDAAGTIERVGWAQALTDWTDGMRRGEVSKANTAMGWALYNNAANSGDVKTAITVLEQMVAHQRSAAQALQATRILKKMSPDAQLYQAQRSVENLQEELNQRYRGKNAPELTIDPKLAEEFRNATDQRGRDEALKNIYRDIGRQMPSRFMDRWNAWRYLAMLGNLRTHVRNVLGNAGFVPIVAAKDIQATAIEAAVSRVSGGRLERSKAAVTFGKQDRALLKAAWGDYARVQESALGGGKYSDFANANKYIEEGRVIFGRTGLKPWDTTAGKALEKFRKFNGTALDTEDVWFSKPHYAYALTQYCKANGITAEQIASGEGLENARNYAVLEAQKATYRDSNALSEVFGRLGRDMTKGKNPASKALGTVMEGILPFRKTPANILARGLEYSPLGLMKGIKEAVFDVRQGKRTGAEAIDSISAGLTGTGLLALGAYLAAQGLIRGIGGDDDDKREFEEMMGHQAYSLELPDGTSITLDWLAPECLPFFIGVNLWELTGEGAEEVTLSDVLASVSMVTEPLLEMSCLQSLNNVFDAVGYAKSGGTSGLTSALTSAATSYLTQALPTLLGQAERTAEDRRYTTYTEKNAFLTTDMQYTLGKASARIPGVDYRQIPYIDAWGREERTGNAAERALNNFLNPAYTSGIETSGMEEELLRLYKATGEGSVFPSRAAKYFTVDKERKDLTAEEYVKYATQKGQTAYTLLSALTGSAQYQAMSDTGKVDLVGDVYTLANQEAKAAISGYEMETWVKNAAEAEKKYSISQSTYILLRAKIKDIESLKDADGKSISNSRGLLIMEAIYSTAGLTERQRNALFAYFNVGKEVRHLNKAAVAEKLAKMRRQSK